LPDEVFPSVERDVVWLARWSAPGIPSVTRLRPAAGASCEAPFPNGYYRYAGDYTGMKNSV